MRKCLVCGAIFFSVISHTGSLYAVPQLINYQGKLTDISGNPVSDSTYSLKFTIYDDSTSGTAIWTETQSSVQVQDGIFNVLLGSVTAIPDSVFDGSYRWIETKVGAETISPRQQIVSVPYALKAKSIDTQTPIGAIVAWAKNIPGVPSLPDGWVECNGQTLNDPDSPLNGQTIPDLNGASGTQRFLRGATTSGITGGSDTHRHHLTEHIDGGFIDNSGAACYADGSTHNYTDTESTLPSYYEVVWIMRVK